MKTFTALASAFILPAAIATATANNEQQAIENYLFAWMMDKGETLLQQLDQEMSLEEEMQRDLRGVMAIPIDELPPRLQVYISAKNALSASLVRVLTFNPQASQDLIDTFTHMQSHAEAQLAELYKKERQEMQDLSESKIQALFSKHPNILKAGDAPSKEEIAQMRQSLQALIAECKANIKPLPKVDNSKEQVRQKAIARLLSSFQIYQLEMLINSINNGKNSNTLQPVSIHQLVQEGKLPITGIGEALTAYLLSDPNNESEREKHIEAAKELGFHNIFNIIEALSASAQDLEILRVPVEALDPAKPETKSEYLPILQHALKAEKARLAKLEKK